MVLLYYITVDTTGNTVFLYIGIVGVLQSAANWGVTSLGKYYTMWHAFPLPIPPSTISITPANPIHA